MLVPTEQKKKHSQVSYTFAFECISFAVPPSTTFVFTSNKWEK